MNKKLILLLTMLIVLSFCATGHASEDNVITLDQARMLANSNSRNLAKYDLKVKKAQYQLYQLEAQRNDIYYQSNYLFNRYNSLYEKYYSLQEQLNQGDESVVPQMDEIMEEIQNIEREMETQSEKISALEDSIESAEMNYDESTVNKNNFEKQLQFEVDRLYVTILNQEDALLTAGKEYELKLNLLNVEKTRLNLGSSSLQKVDQMAAEVADQKKRIVEQTHLIKTLKGKLNVMMGRGYDDELKLVPFNVPDAVEVPKYDQLLSNAFQKYNVLKKLQNEIEQDEDELEDENDYYQSILLGLQIEEKKLQLEDEEIKLKEMVYNLLADLEAKQEDYCLSIINYENAKKAFEWDKKRFEMGHISKLSLMKSELSYLNAKNKKTSSGYAFYLAERTLRLAEEGIFV